MSYKSKRIQQVIEEIDHNKIYLPALQRKFVWGKPQIQLLFDSLMRNYPIGTFLFWNLNRKTAENYVFYEFLKKYDERSPYNHRKTGAFTHDEIVGVLDGQQRLSSIYIGLMGTHCERGRYQRANNADAYEKTCLYLNLLSLPYLAKDGKVEVQEDRNFEFRFLMPKIAASQSSRKATSEGEEETANATTVEAVYWLKVGDVLSWDADPEYDELIDSIAAKCITTEQRDAILNNRRWLRKCLQTLHNRICKEPLLNYFEISKDDLEDILKIFIRVNSGGSVLSKPDLLFSTIVATWDDGREQIEELLKEINNKGDQFSFTNEYLMRCCLTLTDAPIVYKVNSFKSENVQKIQTEWPRIADAVRKTVDLLVEFGFSGSLLTSQVATIIIAYYIYKGGDLGQTAKVGIRKYLLHALLNRIFSSSQDQLLSALRNAFRDEVNDGFNVSYRLKNANFSFEQLLAKGLPTRKSLAVTEKELDKFLSSKKGAESFFLLSLLYPQLRFEDQVFHQDHIHPFARFNAETLAGLGITRADQVQWLERRDCVPNLQLLNGRVNILKNATPLVQWIDRMPTAQQDTFRQDHYFPADVSLELSSFVAFYEKRREILRAKLRDVLAMDNAPAIQPAEEWESQEELASQEAMAEWGATQ
jgi:hypothetical protein